MPTAPRSPRDPDDYLARSRRSALRTILDALPPGSEAPASYVREQSSRGELEATFSPGIRGVFSFDDDGHLWVGKHFRYVVERLNLTAQPGVRPLTPYELRSTAWWMLVELHEEFHGINPADPATAAMSWQGYKRYTHTQVAVEGATHLAAELLYRPHLRRLGVAALEPALVAPDVLDGNGIYRAQKGAMQAVSSFAGDRLGLPATWSALRRQRSVAARLVADGVGDRGMTRLYADLIEHSGGAGLDAALYCDVYKKVAEPVDQGLAAVSGMWRADRSVREAADAMREPLADAAAVLNGISRGMYLRRRDVSVPLRDATPALVVIDGPRGRQIVERSPGV